MPRAKHRSGGGGARTPKGRAASNLTLVVISELVSTAASDMMGHAGDPMHGLKRKREFDDSGDKAAGVRGGGGGARRRWLRRAVRWTREQCKDGFSEQPVKNSRGARTFNID